MTAVTPSREALLACPFCGADVTAKMYGRDMLFKVECNGCGAEMRGFDQCQQDAIDAWNTRLAAKPADEVRDSQVIPNTDPARQFPLYDLMPDFTLADRDPQADERLKLYRDVFAEITAKAIPVCDGTSDDPDRVRHYIVPVGPLHRAAGKLGFQLFNGERHLADAVREIARLKALSTTGEPKR